MTPENADKIIAEFMGWRMLPTHYHISKEGTFKKWENINNTESKMVRAGEIFKLYSQDLNSLVPVWERATLSFRFDRHSRGGVFEEYVIHIYNNKTMHHVWENGKSIQQAASIATAKAIVALGEG